MRKKVFKWLGIILASILILGIVCGIFFITGTRKYLKEVPVIEPKQDVSMYQGDILYLEDLFDVKNAASIQLSTDNPELVHILEEKNGIQAVGGTGNAIVRLSANGANSESRSDYISIEIKEKSK